MQSTKQPSRLGIEKGSSSGLDGLEAFLGDGDGVIVADGSGTVRGKPCGWYLKYLYRASGTFQAGEFFGCASTGTNNYAELYPFIHALWALPPGRYTLVSDSEVTVRIGQGRYQASSNLVFWAAIKAFLLEGYQLTWVYVPRNSTPDHKLCDKKSKEMRKLLENLA